MEEVELTSTTITSSSTSSTTPTNTVQTATAATATTAATSEQQHSTDTDPSTTSTTDTTTSIMATYSQRQQWLERHDSEFSVSSKRYQQPLPTLSQRNEQQQQQQEQDDTNASSSNSLNIWQGAALLTADCLGTGILALPNDISVLGNFVGLGFILLNLPINYYAGSILNNVANHVEQQQINENKLYQQQIITTTTDVVDPNIKWKVLNETSLTTTTTTNGVNDDDDDDNNDDGGTTTSSAGGGGNDGRNSLHAYSVSTSTTTAVTSSSSSTTTTTTKNKSYQSIQTHDDDNDDDTQEPNTVDVFEDEPTTVTKKNMNASSSSLTSLQQQLPKPKHMKLHHDTATFDFIGMTSALFSTTSSSDSSTSTSSSNKRTRIIISRCVMILFYMNIFLVLGDYILVMSHAISAMLGDDTICIPIAGIIATSVIFGVSQIRTMAKLGRSASIISLLALGIVIIQCLYHSHKNDQPYKYNSYSYNSEEEDQQEGSLQQSWNTSSTTSTTSTTTTLLTKLAAFGSIGFAVGSQKLFLNIRHEFQNRNEATKSLGISLSAFGSMYIIVCLVAGSNPPGFLLDAIPPNTTSRRIAGLLLWIHVVVSYAINSQAICGSMDRLLLSKIDYFSNWTDSQRWMILSGLLAISAFFVANAIPFFQDLVSLIGALTSVPLTLLLPAIFYRKGCLSNFTYVWKPSLVVGSSSSSSSPSSWWGWNSKSRTTTTRTTSPTTSTTTTTTTTPTVATPGTTTTPHHPYLHNGLSYALLVFALIFMVAALLGSIDSIGMDWEHHTGGFFACQG